MIDEESSLEARPVGSEDEDDDEVAALVGSPPGRGRAAVSELQVSSLSARFADLPHMHEPRVACGTDHAAATARAAPAAQLSGGAASSTGAAGSASNRIPSGAEPRNGGGSGSSEPARLCADAERNAALRGAALHARGVGAATVAGDAHTRGGWHSVQHVLPTARNAVSLAARTATTSAETAGTAARDGAPAHGALRTVDAQQRGGLAVACGCAPVPSPTARKAG